MRALTRLAVAIAAFAFLFIGAQGVALAIPYTWVGNHDPGDASVNGRNPDYNRQRDLTNNLSNPFNPGEGLIYSADLRVGLHDDSNLGGNEWAYINLSDLLSDGLNEVDFSDTDGNLIGLIELNALGALTIELHRASGDFFFGDSCLVAYGCESNPIPEPATMALLGAGLGLLGFARRKKTA